MINQNINRNSSIGGIAGIALIQLFLTFVMAPLPPEATRALLDFDRQIGQQHHELDDWRQLTPGPLHLLNDHAGHTTSLLPVEPQFEQRHALGVQLAAPDGDWFEWRSIPSPAEIPRSSSIQMPASHSKQLAHQKFPDGSAIQSSPNQLRVEDYIQSGLFDFASLDYEQSQHENIHLHPQSLENPITVTTPSESKHSPIQRSNLPGILKGNPSTLWMAYFSSLITEFSILRESRTRFSF
ncbi:hypothetical protein PtA15_7A24 [Puccinia triticina]|uniref:Uncharacterized protein n=1 Tax=Puccinia triticina TaxID=208348 RepID=A0ABY7CMZ0_9BASI|nr:uncharacterized protein PtA15_7A24 [Puccinia triticina]WAQ86298.1 hypothetical protein PtA15_7A24 [Puccinia triticina]WAR56176.1 hypothetical protein PtB15_7B21 [Puccinia triticina]